MDSNTEKELGYHLENRIVFYLAFTVYLLDVCLMAVMSFSYGKKQAGLAFHVGFLEQASGTGKWESWQRADDEKK